jgi:hypothetical protein
VRKEQLETQAAQLEERWALFWKEEYRKAQEQVDDYHSKKKEDS